jgi:large subunit ribosomal protein L3
MTIGLVGRKCGMTRIFTDAGVTVPVTVVEALPNRISQVKTDKTDGYRAVQVTLGSRRPSRVSKALAGHFAKANVAAGHTSREFRLNKGEGDALATGAELKVDMFTVGQIVQVTGTTLGKGFAGTMKRHNFAGGMKTHGNSLSHRAPGSIGQRQTPGRVPPDAASGDRRSCLGTGRRGRRVGRDVCHAGRTAGLHDVRRAGRGEAVRPHDIRRRRVPADRHG